MVPMPRVWSRHHKPQPVAAQQRMQRRARVLEGVLDAHSDAEAVRAGVRHVVRVAGHRPARILAHDGRPPGLQPHAIIIAALVRMPSALVVIDRDAHSASDKGTNVALPAQLQVATKRSHSLRGNVHHRQSTRGGAPARAAGTPS